MIHCGVVIGFVFFIAIIFKQRPRRAGHGQRRGGRGEQRDRLADGGCAWLMMRRARH
jgi:hypothetical protein